MRLEEWIKRFEATLPETEEEEREFKEKGKRIEDRLSQ